MYSGRCLEYIRSRAHNFPTLPMTTQCLEICLEFCSTLSLNSSARIEPVPLCRGFQQQLLHHRHQNGTEIQERALKEKNKL